VGEDIIGEQGEKPLPFICEVFKISLCSLYISTNEVG